VVAPQRERIGTEALTSVLKEELAGWEQITILGVGNEFGGDDSLGFRAARKLKRALSNVPRVQALTAGIAPENFTGLLRRSCPSHVLLIDAAEMGETAGTIKLIEPHRIEKQMPSTHAMPLYLLTEYLEQELGAKVLILGIQPKSLSTGRAVSSQVEASIDELARMLLGIIGRR
jgi:hydrogenase 3 maturation protease